jgi:shikimate dehydrogenase
MANDPITNFLQHHAPTGPFGMIIGHPVSHSLSPDMHNLAASYHKIDFTYGKLDLTTEQLKTLPTLLQHPLFRGANITVPHKVDMMSIVDDFSDEALIIGAVNTIVVDHHKTIGYNTDAYGFLQPLLPYKDRLQGGSALIFGSGGATRALVYALNQLGMETIWLVARQPSTIPVQEFFASKLIRTTSYLKWPQASSEIALIVNATPLGMTPDVETSPIDEAQKDALIGKIVYDIVYRPLETRLLKMAKQVQADIIDGVPMLIHQGSKAFELWNGKPFPIPLIDQKIRALLHA